MLSFLCAFSQKSFKVKTYFANGKLKENGRQLGINKTGIWNYYSAKGSLERKERWLNGIMRWAILYNEKQQKIKIISSDGTEKLYKGCNCKN
ncbi:MAG: hypothetical protein H7296_08155 [Bacteroidia bacterium]|nr:hypothetical protein [Bacteroidia bacterium]